MKNETATATKFHANNKSDKWVLAIGSVRIDCVDRKQVIELYKAIGDIEDSVFGSACVLAPFHKAVNIYGECATSDISEISKLVNADYVMKHTARARAPKNCKMANCAELLEIRRQFSNMFGWDLTSAEAV